jgi:hypothetical protein
LFPDKPGRRENDTERNTVIKRRFALAVVLAATLTIAARGQDNKYDVWEETYTVQALLGAIKFDDLKFDLEDGQNETVDISILPQIGGAWSTLPKGDRFQYGLETTFLWGFRTKDVDYIQINSGLRARVSISYWTIDFSGGGYVSLSLNKNKTVRIYGAIGPLLMYADYDQDKDLDDDPDGDFGDNDGDDESAFGFGVYGRAGLEFRVYKYGMLGMGVRTVYADLDFSNVGGTTDVRGIAGFVTFTAGF